MRGPQLRVQLHDPLPGGWVGPDEFVAHPGRRGRPPGGGDRPRGVGIAARDTEDLRAFVVENLNADADVAGTQTSLIFEHLRGASPL